jgi:hypothetical protein
MPRSLLIPALLAFLPCLLAPSTIPASPATQPATVGLTAPIGPWNNPKRVASLRIDKPGLYENYIVDADFADVDAVKITADNVTLRNCEIKNARKDGIEVYGSDVTIENCKIHHLLAGTFNQQKDAHGITGRPTRLTVRNCEIAYVSGDCLQFDPGRGKWSDVLIENCRLYTGPLPEDAAGFKKGEQPGENALDTKQKSANPRSRIIIKNSLIHGFRKGGQIGNLAALNLKNHVHATVENCTFYDNEIALRLRGPGKPGKQSPEGGAHVTVTDCRFYHTDTAIRAEDNLEQLTLLRPAFGEGVTQKLKQVSSSKKIQLPPEQPAPPLQR